MNAQDGWQRPQQALNDSQARGPCPVASLYLASCLGRHRKAALRRGSLASLSITVFKPSQPPGCKRTLENQALLHLVKGTKLGDNT